jgi:phosphatidylserine/phosphatidylglycerophosphate/cardiolipin synthase-like enzyme
MQKYTIYNNDDYFQEITGQIAETKQGDRVSLISMVLEPSEQRIRSIIDQITAAAKRDVHVNLVIDAHTFMITKSNLPTGPMFWRRDILKAKFPRNFYEKVQFLEAFRRAGGHYEIINQPITWPSVPIAGRSHIKATVINDEVYIGGCNLGHSSQIDYMIRIRDAKTAAWVDQLISTVAKKKSAWLALEGQDCRRELDDQTTLFVDAGITRQSLIFQEALRIIDEAREWLVITCQFLPSGVTGQHLAQAQARGVKVFSIYNHPLKHDKVTLSAHYLIREREKLRYPKTLFEGELPKNHQRLHAKLIATEQGAMIGSHNYVMTGVRLGTAEIALFHRDAAFARKAISMLLPQLAINEDYSRKLSSISKLT